MPLPIFPIDPEGKEVKLTDYRGKYVVIDFWGSWCHACRHSHPHMRELYEKYHSQGLEFIHIANEYQKKLEEKKEKWLAAIKEDQIGAFTHILNTADNDIVKVYNIQASLPKFWCHRRVKFWAVGKEKPLSWTGCLKKYFLNEPGHEADGKILAVFLVTGLTVLAQSRTVAGEIPDSGKSLKTNPVVEVVKAMTLEEKFMVIGNKTIIGRSIIFWEWSHLPV